MLVGDSPAGRLIAACEPACGAEAVLLAGRHVKKQRRNTAAGVTLYGQEPASCPEAAQRVFIHKSWCVAIYGHTTG